MERWYVASASSYFLACATSASHDADTLQNFIEPENMYRIPTHPASSVRLQIHVGEVELHPRLALQDQPQA